MSTTKALLRRHLGLVLGPALFATALGCGEKVSGEACLLKEEAECPSVDEAAEQLEGTQTCSSPMEEVLSVDSFKGTSTVQDSWQQDTGDTELCCYNTTNRTLPGTDCIDGRPLRHEGVAVTARPASNPLWSRGERPSRRGLSAAQREALAAFWTNSALVEHASVASFNRLALELMGHGAPPELLLRIQVAAADEVHHARAAFALASTYAGEHRGPGPLSVPGRAQPTLEQLAVESAIEGAVGETLAAILAAERLRHATDPAVVAHLERVVRDESEHAELAWAILRWALSRDPSLRAPIAAALARPDLSGWIEFVDAPASHHGLLPAETLRRALQEGMDRVVRPAAELLLRPPTRASV